MDRRAFLGLLSAGPLAARLDAGQAGEAPAPEYRIVSPHAPAAVPGMPGPFPGRVVSVTSPRSLDAAGRVVDEVVREMLDRGMRALTGEATAPGAWRRFFDRRDVVGIKVNVAGAPHVVSSPAIVAEACRRLGAVGIPPARIVVFERFRRRLDAVGYGPRLPRGVRVLAGEGGAPGRDDGGYDPATYVEVSFHGERDTRSHLLRLVSARLTKVINVPVMKDHGATGVTGCLKNVAFGCFSNVARSHAGGLTHTRTAVGAFASVEPLRSRCVLQIMDGLRAVWHGGPFARTPRYVFEPRRILLGTDPVALDRLLLEVIEDKRRAEGAVSIWDRSPRHLRVDDLAARDADPNVNIMIREPGHVEHAGRLGLGVADRARIRVEELAV